MILGDSGLNWQREIAQECAALVVAIFFVHYAIAGVVYFVRVSCTADGSRMWIIRMKTRTSSLVVHSQGVVLAC